MDAHAEVSRLLEKMLDMIPPGREREAERLTDEISTIVMAYSVPSPNFDIFDGIVMSPMERRVAEFLYNRANKFSTAETIRTAIYYDRHGDDQPSGKNLEVYICRLRKHFLGSRFSIENVFGYGYRMIVKDKAHGKAFRKAA